MKELHTEIEIVGSRERVWSVLIDFPAFPIWNPFITRVEGDARVGGRLTVRIQPPAGRGMTFRPRITAVEPGRYFSWRGHLLIPGLLDGEHSFAIEPLGPDRVRFVQREVFSGLLVPVLARTLDTATRGGFEAMNRALKARVEA